MRPFPVRNIRHHLRLLSVDFLTLLGVSLICAALCLALDAQSVREHPWYFAASFVVSVLLVFLVRILLSVYSAVWRYAGAAAYMKLVAADVLAGTCVLALTACFAPSRMHVWVSVAILAAGCVATLSSRFVYQMCYRRRNVREEEAHRADVGKLHKIGVAIVGAGMVGSLLAEELIYNPASNYTPVCFIDKDEQKIGGKVCGIPVFAEGDDTMEKLRTLPVAEIFIALPAMTGDEAKRLYDYYARTGYRVKVYDFPVKEESDGFSVRRVLRPFQVEDLLFRNGMKVGTPAGRAYYEGKTVLVTGGGGSIGSEICRQIARLRPRRLIVFDIYENNAYDLQQELLRKYAERLDLCVEIGSVRDRDRLEAVFSLYRPDVVFHAAAHKHVPLMEHSNQEAIKNNCFGTYNTADMAEKYGAEKFVLISTDKAVNPTNVMGASKRMCEMIVQCRTDSRTKFAAVRFGNVLGSNGSVIPLFRRQIEAGGPLTVTDRRIIRYFMTIPEAAGLVMEAGAMARAGELFVLDMGKPVKIYDLAENMIRLSGLVPHRDIRIVETGLRPGEKLYEELLIKTETLDKTENDTIFIERDTPATRAEVEDKLAVLRLAVEQNRGSVASPAITEAMRRVVPTFRTPEEVNRAAESAEEVRCACRTGEALPV